jgi:hypothetical protein
MGLMPEARRNKEVVNYRRSEKCLHCDHFWASGVCELVDGQISPDMVCDLWEVKSEHPVGKDRGFYEEQYGKANKEA